MKKVITIIGIFGLIFVQAQVGINKDKPDATLDIVAGKTDGSQVEGLLVPRISKEAAYNMAIATTKPQESNLVYVDNANYTFPAGVTNEQKATVSDITEKGYYFWNGDNKWVKTAGKDGAEWVYDPATKQTNLKRSGTTPFTNEVYYDEDGTYVNTDYKTYEIFDSNTNTLVSSPISPHVFMIGRKASNIKDVVGNGINLNKNTGSISFVLDASDVLTAGKNNNRGSFGSSLIKESNNSNNYNWLTGGGSGVEISGSGSDKYIAGSSASVAYRTGSAAVSGYATATRSELWYNSTGSASELSGVLNLVSQQANSGKIGALSGVNTYLRLRGKSDVTTVSGFRLDYGAGSGATAKVQDFFGYYFNGLPSTLSNSYTNAYGLWLGDIEKATNNYAIYTGKGKVRFGDQVEISNINANTSTNSTDKVVVADATTGELKTKPATSLAGAEWVYDPTTKQTNLKRSGTTPFTNEVYYDEDGAYVNTDYKTIEYFDSNTNTFASTPISPRVFMIGKKASNIKSIVSGNGNTDKSTGSNTLYLDASDVLTAGRKNNRASFGSSLIKERSNSNNYNWLTGGGSGIEIFGSGSDNYLSGSSASVVYRTGSAAVSGYATATRSELWYNSTGSASELSGVLNLVSQQANSGKIGALSGVNTYLRLRGKSDVTTVSGFRLDYGAGSGATAKVQDFFGYYFNGLPSTLSNSYTNAYGLWLGDIEKATNNYAIYTGKGKVRFGDNVGIGVDAPAEKLEVNGNIKVQDTGGTALTDNTQCDNPGTISYSGGSFFGCTGANVWKKLHN